MTNGLPSVQKTHFQFPLDHGSLSHAAITTLYLGHTAREQGNLDGALARYREALRLSRELGDTVRIERELKSALA